MSNPKRLYELDALRGIAALGVLACHYTSQCRSYGLLSFEFRWGAYGPHLFFIISGFVILMTLERCNRPWDFIYSRCKRLYPQYWISVLLSALLLALFQPTDVAVPSITQVAVNLTMLQTWLRVPDIEVSYWTLGVELKFYVLLFLLYLAGQLKRIEFFCSMWLASVILFRSEDWLIGPLPHAIATPIILDYAHLFIAGLMSFKMHQKGFTWPRAIILSLAVPFQFLADGAGSVAVGAASITQCVESTVMVSLFCIIFSFFIFGKLRWICLQPLIFLGTISYPLYLVHGTIGTIIIERLHIADYPTPLLLLLPTLASLALATFLQFGAWHLLRKGFGRGRLFSKGECDGETKAIRAV